MRASPWRRVVGRIARFESIEPRLLLSASPTLDSELETIAVAPSVSAVFPTSAAADVLTGLATAQATYGFDGTGQTVVVIDTGIAYRHTAFGSGYGEGYQVVGGYDFAENDADPYDDGNAGSHGTHVAGIIASQDSSCPGVASGVDLVSLRVFDDSGNGSFQWVEQALQWVHTHLNAFANPITTVNLSFGTTWNGVTEPAWSIIEDELALLEADGVFIAVAAGNSFSSYQSSGLSYPASSSHVVPVMSVDNDGSLSYYSQRHSLAIAAPGRSVLSTVPDYLGNRNGIDDDFARFSGTSMAAPYVAAASVLLRQAYEFVGVHSITQDMLYEVMRNTADTIYDAVTHQEYLRLNIQRALDAIMPADDFGSSASAAFQLGTIHDTRSISGVVAQLGDHDYFTFTAGQTGKVTFSLNADGTMGTHWDLASGGTVLESPGNTVSLQVVAGQSYTIGLGTSGGLGHYTINIQLDAGSATPDGSGARQEQRLDNRIGGDGQWFVFTAGLQGLVTFEALFANWRGDIDLELFDANQQFLAGSYSTGNYERIDVVASAGQTFYLHAYVSGWEVNDDVDLRITNLVTQVGDTVYVFGTGADDQFSHTVGSMHRLTINGVEYSFSTTSVTRVSFQRFADEPQGTEHETLPDAGPHVKADSRGGLVRLDWDGPAGNVVDTVDSSEASLSGGEYSHSVMSGEGLANAVATGGSRGGSPTDTAGSIAVGSDEKACWFDWDTGSKRARLFDRGNAVAETGTVGDVGESSAVVIDDSAKGALYQRLGLDATIADLQYAAWAYGVAWGRVHGGQENKRDEIAAIDYVLNWDGVWW